MFLSLVTPDSGLIFWMGLIFLLLLLILKKWGFPFITDLVDKRNRDIQQALDMASQAKTALEHLEAEREELLKKSKEEQLNILREAHELKKELLQQAKDEASLRAEQILASAKVQIEEEKNKAFKEVKAQVADLAIDMTKKILHQEFQDKEKQEQYINSMIEELSKEDFGQESK